MECRKENASNLREEVMRASVDLCVCVRTSRLSQNGETAGSWATTAAGATLVPLSRRQNLRLISS